MPEKDRVSSPQRSMLRHSFCISAVPAKGHLKHRFKSKSCSNATHRPKDQMSAKAPEGADSNRKVPTLTS